MIHAPLEAPRAKDEVVPGSVRGPLPRHGNRKKTDSSRTGGARRTPGRRATEAKLWARRPYARLRFASWRAPADRRTESRVDALHHHPEPGAPPPRSDCRRRPWG